MSTLADNPPADTADLNRRGRRMLLGECAFAHILGATAGGAFMTALVTAFGGEAFELGLARAFLLVGGAVGMLAANPILNAVRSRRKFCLVSLGVVRSLRLVIAFLPVLVYTRIAPRQLYWFYLGCVLVSGLCGMSAEISRRSWIAAIVPPDQRGRFFAKRTMIGTLAGSFFSMGGGLVLDLSIWLSSETYIGLAVVVGFGGMMGWVGWSLLYHAPEPEFQPPRRRTGLLRSLTLPFTRPRFRPLLLMAGWHHFATSIAGGFFHLYMLEHLGLSWLLIVTVDLVGSLLSVAAAPIFGAWSDRHGARRVMKVVMIAKCIFPALWILVTPAHWWVVFIVMGVRAFNSGSQICWIRMALNLSPPRNQAAYLAMHQAVANAGSAAGAIVGGVTARALGTAGFGFSLLGIEIIPLHVAFFASMVLRLSTLPMLRMIREPQHAFSRHR